MNDETLKLHRICDQIIKGKLKGKAAQAALFACRADLGAKNEWGPTQLVTRKNLMTGLEYQEARDTPISCSPASETYWSM